MSDTVIKIPGEPRTKKNSPRIIRMGNGRYRLLPSKQFLEYQELAGWQIKSKNAQIAEPVNIKCLYYMKTHRIVDLVGLLQATDDILTHYGVIADDNSRIIAGHDGSRVLYDKDNPRAEITIERMSADAL